jgi:hypothetical protein
MGERGKQNTNLAAAITAMTKRSVILEKIVYHKPIFKRKLKISFEKN